MRTESSFKNLICAFGGQAIGIIISLIARIVFLKVLTTEYLGLSGLFTNILTILSLTELGFSTAMCYQLYKPIATNDTECIKSLMKLYNKIYVIIGIIIILLGIITIPVYPYLINNVPDISNLNLIYILFVMTTASTYFFSAKKILVISDSKRYIATLFRYSFYFMLNVIQIIILLITKNYILYLAVQIVMNLLENITLSIKANKMYPFLKEKNIEKLDPQIKKDIMKNVYSMFFHKFGGTVLNSTDNIVTSKFIGLNCVGIYSNYFFITNAVNLIISQVFASLIASIGNLQVNKDRKKMTEVFDKVFFLDFWIQCFCTTCLIILLNPFIKIWLGTEYLFGFGTVIVIGINFYLYGMRRTVMAFREATGDYYSDRFSPVAEAIINTILSIIFAKIFGFAGVLLGTIASCLFTCFWIEPLVICKHSLQKTLGQYMKTYFRYTCVGIFVFLITFITSIFIVDTGILSFILKMIIAVIISNTLLLLIYNKNDNFRFYLNFVKNKISKNKEIKKGEF